MEIYQEAGGKQNTYGSIAVDVSSDWTKFPRYGFLSSYGKNEPIEKNIDFMNRCHINGIQFYDWMYDHHKPLAGTPQNPSNRVVLTSSNVPLFFLLYVAISVLLIARV